MRIRDYLFLESVGLEEKENEEQKEKENLAVLATFLCTTTSASRVLSTR